MNPLIDRVMESPLVYRLWIAPFAEQKLRPILAHTDLSRVRRVLDVGCGPGTNTAIFAGSTISASTSTRHTSRVPSAGINAHSWLRM